MRLEALGQKLPTAEVVGDHVRVGIGLEVELRRSHFAAVARDAVLANKGLYGLFELLVEVWGRSGGQGLGGVSRGGEEKQGTEPP